MKRLRANRLQISADRAPKEVTRQRSRDTVASGADPLNGKRLQTILDLQENHTEVARFRSSEVRLDA